MLDLVLRNVHLPEGGIADISVDEGLVVHAGSAGGAERAIDCSGLIVLPGGVDMHVHMRGGRRESHKEDWGSGSRAALAGGVTLVIDQPNTDPPLTTAEAILARVKEAQRDSLCHFGVNAGAVPGAPIGDLWRSGAMAFGEIFLSPSTGSGGIPTRELPRILGEIHALGGTVTIHAEDARGAPPGDLAAHSKGRPPSGEVRAVEAVKRKAPSGMRLHFCHLSTAPSVEAAIPFTCEATPHHLLLSREDFRQEDAQVKVNPPLRSRSERANLMAAWEKITVLASDHAPHTREEKSAPFPTAPAGIPGVETLVPLLLAKVLAGEITLASLVEKTSANPCRILGIPPPGFSPGDRADFALYPREVGTVGADALHSRCGWTPYEGMEAVFPRTVILGGQEVYAEGDFIRGRARWFPGRGYHPRDPRE